MIAFLIALIGTTISNPPQSAGVDIHFPAPEKVARLRITVTVDEQSPDTAWESFLDKLFDYFDRDGDGFLSAAEAARVFPLPLPGGREVKMNFAHLDTDRDGKGSRAEFRYFYRIAGFTSVVVSIRPIAGEKPDFKSIEHQRPGKALFRHLDRDGDGKLTRAELEKAAGLLRRLDENEDEILTPAEILSVGTAGTMESDANALKATTSAGNLKPDAVLHIAFGKNKTTTPKFESMHDAFQIMEKGNRAFGFRVPGGQVGISSISDDRDGFRTAKGFYLAQFIAAIGNKPAMTKAEIEADPSLQALAAMFDVADRNGDGKLTTAELRAFLDLVELGVGCQVVVAIENRGRNLFDLLDLNQDGVLDLAELNQAAKLCEDAALLPLSPAKIPQTFRMSAWRGTAVSTFGPVGLPTPSKPKASVAVAPRGPKWFQAMDRNGDGFVSPLEFIGPPELFRKLDANGDGRISVEEAEAVGKTIKLP